MQHAETANRHEKKPQGREVEHEISNRTQGNASSKREVPCTRKIALHSIAKQIIATVSKSAGMNTARCGP